MNPGAGVGVEEEFQSTKEEFKLSYLVRSFQNLSSFNPPKRNLNIYKSNPKKADYLGFNPPKRNLNLGRIVEICGDYSGFNPPKRNLNMVWSS